MIFALLIVFQIKHYVCDFILQGKYMLGKFKPDIGFVLPLASHCFIHMFTTLSICILTHLVSFNCAFGLALFDFITHFIVDRCKASPHILGRFKPQDKAFWWVLGMDQGIHHVIHYVIIYCLIGRYYI